MLHRIPDLVSDLEKQHEEHRSQLKMQLLTEKKRHLKVKRSLRAISLEQNTIVVDSNLHSFSTVEPISKGDPFVELRRRRNLIVPERAFNPSPNSTHSAKPDSEGRQLQPATV